ncbi:MAG: transposase [Bdellovibrionales bacterium]|nr:transposase [Bdellovibrionales bacterium]
MVRGKPKERFFEQEYTPGEQAQFDFKESIELPFLSGPVIAHLHFGTLPFSNACVIKGFPHKTYECFMDGVHSFFEKIGGQTKNIRIDNLSPCVKRVKKDGGRDYTDAFNRAIKYYDFGVLPCSPGRGNEKGDVERDIQTWSRRFRNHVNVHGIRFRDFSHLNVELEAFGEQEQSEAGTELLKNRVWSVEIAVAARRGCALPRGRDSCVSAWHGSRRQDHLLSCGCMDRIRVPSRGWCF